MRSKHQMKGRPAWSSSTHFCWHLLPLGKPLLQPPCAHSGLVTKQDSSQVSKTIRKSDQTTNKKTTSPSIHGATQDRRPTVHFTVFLGANIELRLKIPRAWPKSPRNSSTWNDLCARLATENLEDRYVRNGALLDRERDQNIRLSP